MQVDGNEDGGEEQPKEEIEEVSRRDDYQAYSRVAFT